MTQHLPDEPDHDRERTHCCSEAQARQQAAWADLELSFRRFATKMYSYLRSRGADHSSAEDTISEAFLKLHDRMLYGPPIRDMLPYLTKTVHNTWESSRRSRPECPRPDLREDYPDPTSEERFERIIELSSQKLKIDALKEAITQLTPRQQAVVVLHEISGLSTRQVAEALDISESTVRVHLSAGKRQLAKLLAISDDNGEGGRP